jgi:phage shock protein PspC (stress-responsive transcriptional regulator)
VGSGVAQFPPFVLESLMSNTSIMMDDDSKDAETAIMGPYQEKSKAFPSLKNKTPRVLKAFLSLDTRVYYGLALLTLLYMFYVGSLTSPIIVFIFVLCTGCMIFTAYLAQWVLAKDEGPLEMSEISDAIRDGAEGFFRTQYGAISKMAVVLAFVIFSIYLFRKTTPEQEAAGLEKSTVASITVLSFLLGALCSGIAGYVGMWVSVRANVRVSSAARRSAREALQVHPSTCIISAMNCCFMNNLDTNIKCFTDTEKHLLGIHV